MSTHLRNSAFVAVIMHVSLAAMPLRAQLAETLPISMTDQYFEFESWPDASGRACGAPPQ